MTYAYDKTYLEKGRTVLGRMLDFAVYDLHYNIDDFFEMFILSGLAKRFERGDFRLLAGKSGVELAYDVVRETTGKFENIKPRYTVDRSPEYWTGWALAYYQWHTSLHFKDIVQNISIGDIVVMYEPFHEMDIRHFVDKMNAYYREFHRETNLKTRRKTAGLSQRELADRTGIPLRTIQQYEQRQKNINKAQVEYLFSLSRALCCDIEDLLEKVDASSS